MGAVGAGGGPSAIDPRSASAGTITPTVGDPVACSVAVGVGMGETGDDEGRGASRRASMSEPRPSAVDRVRAGPAGLSCDSAAGVAVGTPGLGVGVTVIVGVSVVVGVVVAVGVGVEGAPTLKLWR